MTQIFTPGRPVRDVTILLLPGFSNLCLATAIEPLRAANELVGERLYRWRLVSPDGASVATSSELAINVSGALAAHRPEDALFVISAAHYASLATRPLLSELRRWARSARCIGGFDTGSHLLAAAGLLEGYSATIHWEELGTFAEGFPGIDVRRDRYVIDRNRVTAGGATTVLDLMLDVIGRQDGMALALAVAGRFIYDPQLPQDGRETEPQHTVPLRLIARKDPALGTAIALMDSHLEDSLPVARIAELSGIGLRDMERRFRRHLGISPGAHYRSLRLAVARRLLEETELGVGEIAARSGFSSASALSRALRQAGWANARNHRRRRW
ncbi:GlxA family transcriptional regulator [Microbaculum marinum]|uniref:GlxA family transcriptional regulator n=1 Tax=Microbaculum marinum TaxID=1764581 RepID=A0AAW9RK87_9HYPH